MNIKLKYPQQFKKQHKSRRLQPNFNKLLGAQTGTTSFSVNQRTQSTYACYTSQHIILPKKFVSFLRKFLRKFFKRHNIQCWFRIQLNKIISSKSKNSRMGRGVGTMNRTSFSIDSNKPIFIIANISTIRSKQLLKFLSKRLPIYLIIRSIC